MGKDNWGDGTSWSKERGELPPNSDRDSWTNSGGNSGNDKGNGNNTNNNSPAQASMGALVGVRASSTLGVTVDTGAILTGLSELGAFLSDAMLTAAPIAGRLLGVLGMFYPSSIGPEPQMFNPKDLFKNKNTEEVNRYGVTTLPPSLVTDVPIRGCKPEPSIILSD
jgi:hypothetical protein